MRWMVRCRHFGWIEDFHLQVVVHARHTNKRLPGGPSDLANMMTFEPRDEPQLVWSSGNIKQYPLLATSSPVPKASENTPLSLGGLSLPPKPPRRRLVHDEAACDGLVCLHGHAAVPTDVSAIAIAVLFAGHGVH